MATEPPKKDDNIYISSSKKLAKADPKTGKIEYLDSDPKEVAEVLLGEVIRLQNEVNACETKKAPKGKK